MAGESAAASRFFLSLWSPGDNEKTKSLKWAHGRAPFCFLKLRCPTAVTSALHSRLSASFRRRSGYQLFSRPKSAGTLRTHHTRESLFASHEKKRGEKKARRGLLGRQGLPLENRAKSPKRFIRSAPCSAGAFHLKGSLFFGSSLCCQLWANLFMPKKAALAEEGKRRTALRLGTWRDKPPASWELPPPVPGPSHSP